MSLSPRQQAAIENQQKIDDVVANFAARKRLQQGSNEIQTQLSSIGLSDRTKRAQQELSEKFGIPTFDVKGNISTLPSTGVINPDIDVGTGRFSESVFRASIKSMVNDNQNIVSLGAKMFNEVLVAPIVKAFSDLFNFVELSDLTPIQQNQIKTINKEIQDREDEAKKITAEINRVSRMRINPSNRRAAINRNTKIKALIDARNINNAQIKKLKEQRDDLLKQFRGVPKFTEIVKQRTQELDEMINKIPFTVTDKAKLSDLIAQSSQLIEKILKEEISIQQSDLTALQVALKAAAFKLATPISETQGQLDGLLDGVTESLFGIGAFFIEAMTAFGKIFEETLNNLFEITPEKLQEAAELQESFVESVKA